MSEAKQPNYIAIFFTLVALSMLAVVLIKTDLGSTANTVMALTVATVKALLVIGYFMHMKFENRLMLALILIPLAFVPVLVLGLLPDLAENAYAKNSQGFKERPGFQMMINKVNPMP